MNPVFSYFDNENLYPDLDVDTAVSHLSDAIRCRTVNYEDHSRTDFSEFDRLQALMQNSFPSVMAHGQFELIGHAVLVTIPGSDPSLLPCLYMSHQDVVPVVAGTEQDWTWDAFSGAVEDGYIWGRGTLDIKEMVFGILEAAEYLLSHGRSFRRTAYLAFGDDEETLNLGALAVAETLKNRGVKLEFVLDEGSCKLEDGACFGAPGLPIGLIELMEKGYAVIDRKWSDGDLVEINFDMPVEVVAADPRVKEDIGKRAIQRGPIVYCIEEADNKEGFDDLRIAEDASFDVAFDPGKLHGIVSIEAHAGSQTLNYIPYYSWDNREAGKMKVWVPLAEI